MDKETYVILVDDANLGRTEYKRDVNSLISFLEVKHNMLDNFTLV